MAININETQNPTLNIDPTLNEPTPPDLSSIQASIQGITDTVAKMVAERDKIMESAKPQAQPQKNWWDNIKSPANALALKQSKAPSTIQSFIKERGELEKAYLESQGITKDVFDTAKRITGEMNALNAQLNALTMREQAEKLQATGGTQLRGIIGAQEAAITRKYAIEKSSIAAEMAIKLGEYNTSQGRIDEAKKNFAQALEYATYKETQERKDWEWAMQYYQDADKASKDYIQQQFENSLKTEQNKREQIRLELEKKKAELTKTTETGFKDELQNGINVGKTPEEAARIVFEHYSNLGYKVSYIDLLREARELYSQQTEQLTTEMNEGQFDISQTQKKKSWWSWLKPEMPSNIEGVDYKIENGKRVELKPSVVEQTGQNISNWFKQQKAKLDAQKNISMEERQRRTEELLRKEQEMRKVSSPLVNLIKGLFGGK